MNIEYHLEFYPPNDTSYIIGEYFSNTPFLSMNIGDAIHASSFNLDDKAKTLRIKDIQHIIWEIEGSHIGHKLCVYTEEL